MAGRKNRHAGSDDSYGAAKEENKDITSALSAIRTKLERKETERKHTAKNIADKVCGNVGKLLDGMMGREEERTSKNLLAIGKTIEKMKRDQEEIIKVFKDEMKKRKEKDKRILEEWSRSRKLLDGVAGEFEKEVEMLGKGDKTGTARIRKEIARETSQFQNKISSLYGGKKKLSTIQKTLKLLSE